MLTPTPIIPSQWSVWNVHIVAIFAITIFSLSAILWLTIRGDAIPDVFTFGAVGGSAYFLGTRTQSFRDKQPSSKDENL